MATRRVYEIARDRGLTASELIERLERDGIHDKKPLSTIDEELVDAALADTASDVQAAPSESAERDSPKPPPPPHDHDEDAGSGQQLGRMELRRRVRQLRREREAQLKDLGGLAVELRRVGSTRYEELAGKRLEEAAETERELLALERQLSPENVGGVCPSCGLHTKQTRYCLRCGAELPVRRKKEISPLSPIAILAAIALITAAWFVGGSTFGSESGSSSNSNNGGTSNLGPQQAASTAPQFK